MNAVADRCFRPESMDEISQLVRDHERIQIVGASTKPAMATSNRDVARFVMTGLSGVVDHQPSEFLITALAGTSIEEMQSVLANHQQYLPFDPPFAARGATIGGTVAAGLSGAGRLRFGGLRDFIVGVRIVDGLGNQITGGGHVVKNAAGYDLPKLMVGSGGLLGVIVEVTMKVFPKPTHSKTICLKASSIQSAANLQNSLARSPIDVAAIDMTPDGSLWIRMEGAAESLNWTTARIQSMIDQGDERLSLQTVTDASAVWEPLAAGTFAGSFDRLVRAPLTPSRLLDIDASLEELTVRRRYSVAGNVVWIAWPAERPVQQLDECLRHHAIGATVLTGDVPLCRIGVRPNASMLKRIKSALDPANRFVGR